MNWTGVNSCRILILALSLAVVACGQKKIDGPYPATGEVSLRVLYLVDPRLPALSEAELRHVLDLSEQQMQIRLSRRVRFAGIRKADLQQEFDRLKGPFKNIRFANRLDPSTPLSEESKRLLYARIMELLRTDRLRPLFPQFSLDPKILDMAVILDTLVKHVDRRFDELRRVQLLSPEPFLSESCRDRRSIFAWFTLLGGVPADTKPADLILTNDLLIFDSINTLPPQCLVSGSVTVGYTRVYPGIALVSTLPFLSKDDFFRAMQGKADGGGRLETLAWAISREVGGKLIDMAQDEFDHPGCLNRVMAPPFAQAMEDIRQTAPCLRDHRPLDRRQLLADYMAAFTQISK